MPPYNQYDFYIQYDGFTTVLEAKRQVIPCETYHLKIAIADDADYVWDSRCIY
ncbi:MAG: choice-of-anchor L domain-containing protein [Bacteroidetes bacterium]|nr:choice-of-anchor L domain-containing protein [Bacteroidota bacterium]